MLRGNALRARLVPSGLDQCRSLPHERAFSQSLGYVPVEALPSGELGQRDKRIVLYVSKCRNKLRDFACVRLLVMRLLQVEVYIFLMKLTSGSSERD